MEAEDHHRNVINELNSLHLKPQPRTLRNTLYEQFRKMEEVEARQIPNHEIPKSNGQVITKDESAKLRDSVSHFISFYLFIFYESRIVKQTEL